MEKELDHIPFEDGIIQDISLTNDSILVTIELYNGIPVRLQYEEYYMIIDRHSIGQEIGNFEIKENSAFLQNTISAIFDCGGTKNETNGIKHFIFYESWNENPILEIIYKNLLVK